MKEFLATLDPQTLYIVGFIVIVLTILLVIKKVIMLAVMTGILALVVFLAVPVAETLQDSVRYDSESKSLVVVVEDEEIALNVESLKSVKVEEGKILFSLANGKTQTLEIPNYVITLVTSQLEKQGIEVKQ